MTGSIANVKIEYSTNGGGAWVTPAISDSTIASLGEKDWLIPPAVTPNAKVRISDVIADSGVDPVLSSAFKIVGSFSFVAPSSGTTWVVTNGEIANPQKDIIWGTQGVVPSVNLYYSKTGSAPWTLINTSAPIADGGLGGSYPWTVPDAVANTVKIRIEDSADNETFLESAAFTIEGDLQLTSPVGGEKWSVGGAPKAITWKRNSSSIQDVYIEYFDGTVWQYIPDPADPTGQDKTIPNSGSFGWTVPDSLTNAAKIRITAVGYPSVTETSPGTFRIMAGFTVVHPNGGEALKVATNTTISWTCTSTHVQNVRIDYSTDGGTTYDHSISLSTPNTGSLPWLVPPTVSKTAKVRVMDAADNPINPDACDFSDFDFFIRADFNIGEPNGRPIGHPEYPQNLVVGRANNVTWTSAGDLGNVKLEYSHDSNGNFNIDSHTIGIVSNSGIYPWTIPDGVDVGGTLINNLGNTVKLRISDPNDPEANDVSIDFFRIITGFTVLAPNGPSDQWEVGSQHNITWTCTSRQSFVPQVKIEYSTNGGAAWTPLVVTDNTGTYPWTVLDVISPEFKIRVSDLSNSDAVDISDANAKVKAKFTLLTPNGGPTQELTVGDDYNITWQCTGTVANVKLEYSDDNFITPHTIIASTPNDGTHPWRVPNIPSTTMKVRVSSAIDPDAYAVSASTFKIVRGILHLTAPQGGERWVTRETRQIIWETTSGSIPKVNIEYSKDNFVSDVHTIALNYDSRDGGLSNTLDWTVPDDRSATVKVRISDIRDVTVNAISNNFTIDYYSVICRVRDLITNQDLAQLNVDATSDKGDAWRSSSMPENPEAPLGSPVTVKLPYGFWTMVWSKTGYGDKQNSFMCDRDQTLDVVFLETTAVHIWRAYSDYTYEPTTDTLRVDSWLERDGTVVTGGTRAAVYIYDGSTLIDTNPATPPCGQDTLNNTTREIQQNDNGTFGDGIDDCIDPLLDTSPDSTGFFSSSWANCGLQSGKVYTTLTDIVNASGAHFRTPGSFTITEAKKLQEMSDAVTSVLDKPISEVNAELQSALAAQTSVIQTKLDDQKTMIETKMDEQKTIIEQKTDQMITAVNTTLTSFETRTSEAITKLQSGAEAAVSAGQTLQETAEKFSWQATVSPNPGLSNDVITLSCQGMSRLSPMLSIYSWDNKTLISNQVLIETTPGLYTYQFTADDRFTPGKAYTYIVTESKTGGLVSGSGMIESMGLTTVAGLASAAPEAERAAKKALDAIKAVEAVLVSGDNMNIALTLKNLKESVDALPEVLSKEGPSAKLNETVNNLTDWLKTMVGQEGLDIGGLMEKALTSSPTIKEMRGKTDEINQVIDILMQLFESKFGGMDAPIISTSLQPGSVRFRIVAINPSKTRSQKIQVKNYLPEEVTPKDIADLGGLELEYDSAKSIYYVYKTDLELAPGEMRVFEVEVEDIWNIPKEKIDELKERTDIILGKVKNTEYYEKAKEVADTIYPRLSEIAASQADEAISREQHIGVYRQNTLTIDRIKEDLAKLEKMLATAGGPLAPEMLAKTKIKAESPTKTMTWVVIFILIIFVALLAAVLFFSWHRQARITREELLSAKKSAFPGPQDEGKE
ncbi:MAG: hypothetical protein ACM3IL_01335 [Deltaproteobacteria bacterium]